MWRSDAIATLYFFRPLLRLISSTRTGVPILMYHSVSDAAPDSKHPYFQTVTSLRVFEQHMKFLRERGFSTVTLAGAREYLDSGSRGSIQPVVITFDDGFRDFLTHAFPILQRYGFSASMFLPTGMIAEDSQNFKGLECLSWSEVRDLHRAGVEFGSHTVTHPLLSQISEDALRQELNQSKQTMEQQLGCPVTSFAYPYAFPETDHAFVRRLRATLAEAGYRDGVTTMIGVAGRSDDRFFLKRLPVNSCDDARLFGAKLDGAYNWLHTVQYVSKLRHRTHAG